MRSSVRTIGCAVALVAGFVHSLFAVGAKLDVSQIVNQAMAESILDSKVKVTAPRNSQGGDGYYSKCNYYSAPPGKTLLLRVYRAAEGYYAQYEFDVVTQNTPSLKTVPGLGDKAMVTGGKASALPASSMMLYVLKGNVLLTVGLSGFDDENASLSKARTVAEKILAQL